MSATNFASQNQLLTTLSFSESLLSSLKEVTSGVIHHPDRLVAEVYFPQTAICFLAIAMSDNSWNEKRSYFTNLKKSLICVR